MGRIIITEGLHMENNGIRMFIDEPPITGARIKVIGVGGGGGNAGIDVGHIVLLHYGGNGKSAAPSLARVRGAQARRRTGRKPGSVPEVIASPG